MLFIPYWHDFHFWFIHRMIHFEPLYKYVHSLHHKSDARDRVCSGGSGGLTRAP